MKDSLDILRTDIDTDDSVAHYGVRGMKWKNGRKKYVTNGNGIVLGNPVNGNNHGLVARKKNVTSGGNGVQLGASATGSAHGLTPRKKKVTEGGNGVQLGGVAGGASAGNMSAQNAAAISNQMKKKLQQTSPHSEIMALAKKLAMKKKKR